MPPINPSCLLFIMTGLLGIAQASGQTSMSCLPDDLSGTAQVYDARIQEGEILTPKPEAAPRINGPALYGARPGKKFLYRIPTQGERPIHFKIENLPTGLEFDTDKGILTGITPAKTGDYVMSLSARNEHGVATRSFKLVVGENLVLTPPVGWNSWGAYMLMVTDKKMRMAADLLVEKGLADVGFQYVSIDDAWMRISPQMFEARKPLARHEGFDFTGMIGEVRDAEGNILPNSHFPDMKGMVDYIHAYGLKAGIYSSPGPQTCQNFAGSFGHELRDAKQYAAWGFDFLKYDQCSAYKILDVIKKQSNYDFTDFWRPMVDALRQQDRDIVYNLCEYGDSDPWTWAPGLNMQTWRTGGDLNHNVRGYFDEAMRVATELRDYSKPGQWNDPDYMYIHKIRSHKKMVAPAVEIPLTTNQRYQYVTLWSMIAAPFVFSCDMDEINEFTFRLMGNADVVGINQDELGEVAAVVEQSDQRVVMIKELANGSRAVALLNRDEKEAYITLKADWLGSDQPGRVLDAWRQKTVKGLKAGDGVALSPHGVVLFIVAK